MANTFTWDVPLGQPIEYFDIEQSFELTGFRPINDTQGLDFNPNWFREDALNKLKTGRYSPSSIPIGSKTHVDWWRERIDRCNNGYTVNGYRITGDNYFFLNFYNLKSSDFETINQTYGFPEFLVFQYEYFHYLEMCEKLKKDTSVLKSRGIGFSEMASSFIVRPYTTIPNFRSVVSAFSKNHLTPTLSKIWLQMDWLNENTEGALRRVRMNINTATHKRASKKDKDGSESGHRSEVEGLVCDEVDKLRGDRTQILIYEEAGADTVLLKKWVKGEALISVLGGKRVGRRIAFGTGGSSKASSMQGLKKMTLNPQAYNILPVRHNFTQDGKYIISGLFIPAYRIVYELIDSRGWCNVGKAKEYYLKERSKLIDEPKDLLEYKSEYCFTIEEALIQHSDNLFPVEEIAEQLAHIDIYKDIPLPKAGFLTWAIDENTKMRNGKVKWREDPDGNILIAEHPIMSEEGTDYNNLYVGGIDSIDIGATDSAQSKKANETVSSEFCIVIKKRILGLQDPKYVAMYKDSPRDPREAYENAAKLLTYYYAKAVLESTRTTITTYFRDHKYLSLLMKRPRATMPDISKGNSNMYGTPATVKVIEHYRELIYDFCLDYCYTISFREILDQLLNYSDEDKKKFDIVAAMGMCELADEELSVKKPEAREPQGKKFQDIGWWTDNKGYKHYGVIPQTREEKNDMTRKNRDETWINNEPKSEFWENTPHYRKFSQEEWATYNALKEPK